MPRWTALHAERHGRRAAALLLVAALVTQVAAASAVAGPTPPDPAGGEAGADAADAGRPAPGLVGVVHENVSRVAVLVRENVTAVNRTVRELVPDPLLARLEAATVEGPRLPRLPSLPGVPRGSLDDLPGLPALVAGYSRYDDSDPLDCEQRAAVYDCVRESPGVHVSALTDATGVPRSTVRHHVRVLAEENLVEDELVRGKRRVFPVDHDGVALSAALADDATAAVLSAVGRLEPVNVSTLADHLDRSASTVSHHLASLEADGLVERTRVDGQVQNSLTPRAAAGLEDATAASAD